MDRWTAVFAMTHLPKLIEHPDYLEFVVPEGKQDEAYWQQVLQLLVDSVEKTGKRRILVERPFQKGSEQVEGMVVYRIALRTAEVFGVTVRLAVLSPIADESSFFETVATNRGAIIQVGNDRETLLAWLLSDA